MKNRNKGRKTIQIEYAKKNIQHYFNLLENNFNKEYEKKYIEEITKISQSFNITLKREEKLKFCKKCNTFWTNKTRQIRLNPTLKTKEYICLNCTYVKRFKYKN